MEEILQSPVEVGSFSHLFTGFLSKTSRVVQPRHRFRLLSWLHHSNGRLTTAGSQEVKGFRLGSPHRKKLNDPGGHCWDHTPRYFLLIHLHDKFQGTITQDIGQYIFMIIKRFNIWCPKKNVFCQDVAGIVGFTRASLVSLSVMKHLYLPFSPLRKV